MQTRSSTTVLLHSIFWLLVLHLLFDWTGLYYSFQVLFDIEEPSFDEALLIIPLTISLFYWNSNFLIPRFLTRQTWGNYLIGIVLSFFLHLLIGGLMYFFVESQGLQVQFDLGDFLDDLLMFQLIGVAMSSAWRVSNIAFENSERRKEAEQKQKEAELKYLNAQFNPHFLFNTLNGIYAQAVEEDAPQTTESILLLSEIMRYPIKNGTKQTVSLADEITFIENYIALQRLRLGEDYPIHFEKEIATKNIQIAPLCLITLVENAFKYGVSQHLKTPISFQISLQDKHLCFQTKNKISSPKDKTSHLIGIENLKSRLAIIYGEHYSLDLEESNNLYLAKLTIKYVV